MDFVKINVCPLMSHRADFIEQLFFYQARVHTYNSYIRLGDSYIANGTSYIAIYTLIYKGILLL